MEIIKQGISIDKPDGTHVDYFIFPEYEIHYNELQPRTIQQWHHHNVIEETIFVISGKIEIHWQVDKILFSEQVSNGDVIRVENTPHTLMNNTDCCAKFIVFRFVPTGKDNRELIKNDKHLDII
ncbi:MAG: cupin domain-containing protein [Bacteroidota bacterium]